ncbi:MAG: hypothetical protein ACAI25_00155 [Planctomycetota bacterium]
MVRRHVLAVLVLVALTPGCVFTGVAHDMLTKPSAHEQIVSTTGVFLWLLGLPLTAALDLVTSPLQVVAMTTLLILMETGALSIPMY